MNRLITQVVLLLIISTQLMLAQALRITGKVTSADTGEPLPGVNVVVKGTSVGTATDVSGKYVIEVSQPDAELVFSYVGYVSETVNIQGKTVIDVVMIPDVQALSEVVVVGYGTMERANVTGAISSLKSEDINKIPVSNVVEALKAQVPGVRVTKTSGRPGSGVDILIRGKKSIGEANVGMYHIGSGSRINENEPLIVIDGVPIVGGSMDEININDVASIDILKDAAAASIYGARGTNGVILITTKNGTAGKPLFSANFSYGFTDLTQKPTMFNAEEYRKLKYDARIGARNRDSDTATLEGSLTDPIEVANWLAGKEIDWHDVLLRKGNVKDIGLSVTGGTDKFRYYMNGGVYLEDGIVQHSDYHRYSLRVNSDYSPFSFLTAGVKVQLSRSDADETGNSAVVYQENPDFTDFLGNSPLGRIRDDNGNLVSTVKGDQFQYNPLFKYQESQADRIVSRNFISPYLKFTFFKDLTYTINGFIEQRNEDFKRFTTDAYNEGAFSTMAFQNIIANTYLLDHIVNYKKSFAKHAVDITFVYGFQKYRSDMISADDQRDQGSMWDAMGYYSFPAHTADLSVDESAILYYVGRLGYNFDSRYNLTATIRRDGSSKFGPKNRWGTFPSVSFAWIATNEAFLKENNIIDLLKFRIGYGVLGNDRIPNYRYVALTGDAIYSFNGLGFTGKTTGNFPNESLKWEESKQVNTGIDIGVLRNKITATVDYYNLRTTDLLLPERIDPTTGFDNTLSNVGKLKGWGLEANLNAKVIDGTFKWSVGLNWAKDKHELVRLNRASVDAQGRPVSDPANGWFIGQDIDVIYDYDFIGIYQLGEEEIASRMHPDRRNYGPGDPKIRDINGDSVINSNDRTFLGSQTPKWYGGLRNTFSYKGLELSILFESVQGVTKINYFYGSLVGRDNQVKVDYWTPTHPSNEFPEPSVSGTYAYENAVRVRDASFIALRNVSLQYSIPSKILNKMPIKSMLVYIRGNNLKYFTKYKVMSFS